MNIIFTGQVDVFGNIFRAKALAYIANGLIINSFLRATICPIL